MASLFDRLVGINLPEQGGASDSKIAVHAFTGALSEFMRGKLTGAEVVSMFSLDAAQSANAVTLKDLLVDAPEKVRFMRVLKDWLYLGETATGPRYLSAATLISRLQDEVTDQGGTVS